MIAVAVLIVLCIVLLVLHRSPSTESTATGTEGTTGEMPGTSGLGSDNEIDFGDLLNPDADSSMGDNSNATDTPLATEGTKPDASSRPDIPDATEGGNSGYSNGWY